MAAALILNALADQTLRRRADVAMHWGENDMVVQELYSNVSLSDLRLCIAPHL